MSKVTSKRQVTIPKKIADQYDIAPGDEVSWQPAGDVVRVVPPGRTPKAVDREVRLQLFDRATERQRDRDAQRPVTDPATGAPPADRGWTREELYGRDRSR